jgi:ABC-type proline/glycine betaine transport system ATPase subunit
MDSGSLVEYASPHELLQNPKSKFYKLCQATGKIEFRTLQKLAAQKEEERKRLAGEGKLI